MTKVAASLGNLRERRRSQLTTSTDVLPRNLFCSPRPPHLANTHRVAQHTKAPRRAVRTQFDRNEPHISGSQTERLAATYDRQAKIDRSQNTRFEGSLFGGGSAGAYSTWVGDRQRFHTQPMIRRSSFSGLQQFGKPEDSAALPFSRIPRWEHSKTTDTEHITDEVGRANASHMSKFQKFSDQSRVMNLSNMSSSEQLCREKRGPGIYQIIPRSRSPKIKFSKVVRWDADRYNTDGEPGRYSLDQNRRSIPGFALPVIMNANHWASSYRWVMQRMVC